MKPRFKKGDLVVCIDNSFSSLIVGKIYKVIRSDLLHTDYYVYLEGLGPAGRSGTRFMLADGLTTLELELLK